MNDLNRKKNIKKASKTVAARLKPRSEKGNRTVSLDNGNFEKLAKYCQENHIPVSHVLDELIAEFLVQVG